MSSRKVVIAIFIDCYLLVLLVVNIGIWMRRHGHIFSVHTKFFAICMRGNFLRGWWVRLFFFILCFPSFFHFPLLSLFLLTFPYPPFPSSVLSAPRVLPPYMASVTLPGLKAGYNADKCRNFDQLFIKPKQRHSYFCEKHLVLTNQSIFKSWTACNGFSVIDSRQSIGSMLL